MVNIVAYEAANGKTVLMNTQETQNSTEHKAIVKKLSEEQAAMKSGILQVSATNNEPEDFEVYETD